MEAATPQTMAKAKNIGVLISAPRVKEAIALDGAGTADAVPDKAPCDTPAHLASENLASPQSTTPDSADADESLKRKLAFDEKGTPVREGKKEPDDATSPEDTPKPAPVRASRTTATKISPALIDKVRNNQTGFDLKITATAIPFDALSNLCEALATNESTERLDLEGCGIGDKGCVVIRDLLVKNTRIVHLDLQMNQITDVGCRCLSEILQKNNTLSRMFVPKHADSTTHCIPVGRTRAASVLSYLGYNDIRDDGVHALIAAMRPRGQLEIVVSGNTHVSDQALARLDRALEQQWKPTMASKVKKEGAGGAGSGASSPRVKKGRSSAGADDEAPAAKKSKGNVGSVEVAASPAAAAARAAAKAKRLAEKARLEEWVPDKNLHYGAPFTYTFEERGQPSYWSSDLASSDGPKPLELQRLAAKFRLQWSRLRASAEDQLVAESRQLTIGQAPRGSFDAACRFLAMRGGFGCSAPLWGTRTTEEDRIAVVEGRLKALSVKLRHMAEDMVREQRAEAEARARACVASQDAETLLGSDFVSVPCPFGLTITMAQSQLIADAPEPIVVF